MEIKEELLKCTRCGEDHDWNGYEIWYCEKCNEVICSKCEAKLNKIQPSEVPDLDFILCESCFTKRKRRVK